MSTAGWRVTELEPGLLVAESEGSPNQEPVHARLRLQHAIGRDTPRHWYHVGRVVHAARALGIFQEQATLLLGNDLTGAAELCELRGQGPALQALIAAALARLPAGRVIVELPGLRDTAGQSPFWQGLGRHFYGGDPHDAMARHGPAWRGHVAALLPRQPLYTAFLPDAAQAAIGLVAPEAAALQQALRAAGFQPSGHVCIDDGGPVLALEHLPS